MFWLLPTLPTEDLVEKTEMSVLWKETAAVHAGMGHMTPAQRFEEWWEQTGYSLFGSIAHKEAARLAYAQGQAKKPKKKKLKKCHWECSPKGPCSRQPLPRDWQDEIGDH